MSLECIQMTDKISGEAVQIHDIDERGQIKC